MTDKELRRSSRKELIEMLYYLRKELDDVRAENERLNARFDLLLGEAKVDDTGISSNGDTETGAEEGSDAEAPEPEKDRES